MIISLQVWNTTAMQFLQCRGTAKNFVLLVLSALIFLLFTYGYLNTHYSVGGSTQQLTSLIPSSRHLTQLESEPITHIGISNRTPITLRAGHDRHKTIHHFSNPTTKLLQNELNLSRYVTNKPMLQQDGVSSSTLSEGGGGYVLAEDYWEQMSSASRNLQNLQCWAGKLGLNVVEPFAVNSVLRTSLTNTPSERLKFSDLVDMESWNTESVHLGSARIQSWKMFLRQAPRDVIAVQFKYAYSKEIKSKQNEMRQYPAKYPPREIRYKQGCSTHPLWPKQTSLEEAGFKLVQRVCLNFEYGDVLTLDEFKNEIYGQHDPESVTVYFKQWRGLASTGRIPVRNPECGNTGIQEHMRPSQRLLAQTSQYISKYLTSSTDLTNSAYIAIMARLEKSKISFNNRPGIVPYCLNETIKQWRVFVTKTGLNRTFLSIDIGKYGSNSFKRTGDSSNLGDEFHKFFRALYDDHITITEWEKSFEDVGQTKDSGYISLLQKMVVTRATCVMFVGGGSFQKHALTLYKERVPQSQWCVHVVKECTLNKNLQLHH